MAFATTYASTTIYMRGIVKGWMANIDTAPWTSLRAVINYIAKYCSKAETKTQPYKEMLTELLPKVSHARPMVSLVAKTMNKLLSETTTFTPNRSPSTRNTPTICETRLPLLLPKTRELPPKGTGTLSALSGPNARVSRSPRTNS